jgi:PAS domain S-box-containing protein
VYGYVIRKFKDEPPAVKQIIHGAVFGAFVYGCMHVKIPVAQGVLVDQRNAIIILSGIFGGPISALGAAAVGIGYRAYLGGVGFLGGSFGMLLSALAGLTLRRFRDKLDAPWKMAAASLASAIFILPGFLPIGNFVDGLKLMAGMAVPYGSAITVGVLFGSLLLQNEERRQSAALRLLESESRYRGLFESLIDVSFRIDRESRCVLVSPSVERILGYAPEELIGKPAGAFIADPARYRNFKDVFAESGKLENEEIDLLGKDGSIVTVSVNARRVDDGSGALAWYDGVMRDVTQARRAAEERARLEEALGRSQKMQAIGQLAGGIAHDFNNMLSGIIGFTEVAIEQVPADNPAKGSLAHVLSASERAKRLVERILTFSRGAAAEVRAARLRDVVVEALNLLKMTIPASVGIETDLRDEFGTVLVDVTQVHEAIMNLATNGVHAMNGKGVLVVSVRDELVGSSLSGRIGSIGAGRYSVIEIRDTGKGMDKDLIEKAFEPFFTTKPPGEGTGMGLSVVYGIMQGHGGDIVLESEPGKGTVVRLYFPQIEGMSAEESGGGDGASTGDERVLFVDDEPMLAELAEKTLRSLGYSVTAIADPIRALEILKADPRGHDVLVTDQNMPGMTGMELAREAMALNPALPVILCTGFSSAVGEAEALASGIRKVCMKPVKKLEMGMTLRSVLDGGRSPSP